MVKLQTYKFNNDILEIVENGKQWIGVKSLCVNIGLAFIKQHQKLKSNPAFKARLVKAQTPGGMQEVFCIPLEKLNGWLFTINPNKVRTDIKDKLIKYQEECFEVLYNHFNQKQTYINKELETKLIEKDSFIFQLQDEMYQLKNRNANLVRALNSLTKQKEENLQSELARFGNNALEAIFQITNIQKELEETKNGIDAKLNRIEIFKQNIEKVMPKPALVGINKKGEKEYVEIPLSELGN